MRAVRAAVVGDDTCSSPPFLVCFCRMECSPELIRGEGYQFDNSDFQVILRNTNDEKGKQLVFCSYSRDVFGVVSDFRP